MKELLCGCGHGEATHPFEGLEGLRLHVLGEGNCARKLAIGNLVPTNFRFEVWTTLAGTPHESTFLTEVCDVNGQTITAYTLKHQRMYSQHEDGSWSLLKSEESTISIGEEW